MLYTWSNHWFRENIRKQHEKYDKHETSWNHNSTIVDCFLKWILSPKHMCALDVTRSNWSHDGSSEWFFSLWPSRWSFAPTQEVIAIAAQRAHASCDFALQIENPCPGDNPKCSSTTLYADHLTWSLKPKAKQWWIIVYLQHCMTLILEDPLLTALDLYCSPKKSSVILCSFICCKNEVVIETRYALGSSLDD